LKILHAQFEKFFAITDRSTVHVYSSLAPDPICGVPGPICGVPGPICGVPGPICICGVPGPICGVPGPICDVSEA
jgi:hypothetical protein